MVRGKHISVSSQDAEEKIVLSLSIITRVTRVRTKTALLLALVYLDTFSHIKFVPSKKILVPNAIRLSSLAGCSINC